MSSTTEVRLLSANEPLIHCLLLVHLLPTRFPQCPEVQRPVSPRQFIAGSESNHILRVEPFTSRLLTLITFRDTCQSQRIVKRLNHALSISARHGTTHHIELRHYLGHRLTDAAKWCPTVSSVPSTRCAFDC